MGNLCDVQEPPDYCWESGSALTFEHTFNSVRVAGLVAFGSVDEGWPDQAILSTVKPQMESKLESECVRPLAQYDGTLNLSAVAACMLYHTTNKKKFVLLMSGEFACSDPSGRHFAGNFEYDVAPGDEIPVTFFVYIFLGV